MRAQIELLLAKAQNTWQARAPRERQLMTAAAAILLLGGVYVGVYEPAAQGIAKLKQTLPKTQMQAAQAEQLAAQIAAQAPQTQGAIVQKTDVSSKAGLDASLQASGIAATQASVAAAAPFAVTVQTASGDQLWAWLSTAPLGAASFKRSSNGAWQGTATP